MGRKIKIHREGYRIIAGVFILLVIINVLPGLIWPELPLIHYLLIAASVVFMIFIVLFFRTPARPVEPDPLLIYAPADGVVVFTGENFGYCKNRTRNYLLSQDRAIWEII